MPSPIEAGAQEAGDFVAGDCAALREKREKELFTWPKSQDCFRIFRSA